MKLITGVKKKKNCSDVRCKIPYRYAVHCSLNNYIHRIMKPTVSADMEREGRIFRNLCINKNVYKTITHFNRGKENNLQK